MTTILDAIIQLLQTLQTIETKYDLLEYKIKKLESRMPEPGYRIVSERENDD